MQPDNAGTLASQPPPSASDSGSTMIAYSFILFSGFNQQYDPGIFAKL